MKKTIFRVSKMDCPSEENLIRLKLEPMDEVVWIGFDIPNRRLEVIHQDGWEAVQHKLSELNLGDEFVKSDRWEEETTEEDRSSQRRLLWTVLAINLAFFVIEMLFGLISRSMGLVADSLDMLADAFVYGISLMAVGAGLVWKKRVARLAGYFQIILALLGFAEVLRRVFSETEQPDFVMMAIVAFFALIANSLCLWLLQRSRSQEAHMQASMIFTSNDVIINAGVILAGLLVWLTHSAIPDLVVGAVVFVLVLRGARRILKLA